MVVVVEAVLVSLLSAGTNPGEDPEILIREERSMTATMVGR